jgi:Cu/Ag efflux pump CusA
MAKNELLIKTAEFDEKIRDAYKAWQKKNPSEGAEMFKGSEEEKAIRNAYNDEVKSLNAKYFAARKGTSEASKDVQDLRTKLRQQMGF